MNPALGELLPETRHLNRQVTVYHVDRIKFMHRHGLTAWQIASKLGLGQPVVERVLAELLDAV